MKSSLAVCCVKTVTVHHWRMRLQCSVLHPVLVNVQVMEDLRVARGVAGQQTFLFIAHQPLLGVSSHVAGHMLFCPCVEPDLKASVQASVDPLVRLKETRPDKNIQHDRYRNVRVESQVICK